MEKLVADTIRAVAMKDATFRKEVLAGGGTEPPEYTGKCKPSRKPRKGKCGKNFHKYKRPKANGKFEDCCMRLAIRGVRKLEKVVTLQSKRIELMQKLQAYGHIWDDAQLDRSVYDTVHVIRKPNGKIKKYKFTAKTLKLKLKSVQSKLKTVIQLLKSHDMGMGQQDVKQTINLFKKEYANHKRRLAGGGNLGDMISTFATNVWTGMRTTMAFLWEHKWEIITGLVVLTAAFISCGSYPTHDSNDRTVILYDIDGIEALRAIPEWLSGINVYHVVGGMFAAAAAVGFIQIGTSADKEEAAQHDAQALMQQYDAQRAEENKFLNAYAAQQQAMINQMQARCPPNTLYNVHVGRCMPVTMPATMRGGSWVSRGLGNVFGGIWGIGSWAVEEIGELDTGLWRSTRMATIDTNLDNAAKQAYGSLSKFREAKKRYDEGARGWTDKLRQYDTMKKTDYSYFHDVLLADQETLSDRLLGPLGQRLGHSEAELRELETQKDEFMSSTGCKENLLFPNPACYNEWLAKINAKKAEVETLERQFNARDGVESRVAKQIDALREKLERQQHEIRGYKDRITVKESVRNEWVRNSWKESMCGGLQCAVIVAFGIAYLSWWNGQWGEEEEDDDDDDDDDDDVSESMYQAYQQVQQAPQLETGPMVAAPQLQMVMGGSDLIDISA